MDIFEEILAARRAGTLVVLATVIESQGSAPRGAGARMIVREDGTTIGTVGGGAIEKLVVDEARTMMNAAEARILKHNLKDIGMECGGGMTVFLEPMNPGEQLIVFGAGHIGKMLSELGKLLEFQVTVVDDRPDFANRENLPGADSIYACSYQEAIDQIVFTPQTSVVILTYKHAHDFEVLEQCIRKPSRYIGMIGSRKKVTTCFDQLRQAGVTEELIERVHAPVGLNIAANTPAEIAVSIAAELIEVRNGASAAPAGGCPSAA